MTRAPSAPATSRSACCSTCSACRLSVVTTAADNSARCHRSWWSVSDTDTLNCRCSRSLRLFTIFRFSFSDWHAARWSSQVMSATITGSRPPRRASRRAARVERASHFLDAVRLDQVADLHVVEVLDADTALEPLAHLTGVVFEPLQRRQRPVIHLDARADNADPGGARDDPAPDEAPGDRADLGDLEELPHLRFAQHDLLLFRREQAFHRRPHFIHGLVDDAV